MAKRPKTSAKSRTRKRKQPRAKARARNRGLKRAATRGRKRSVDELTLGQRVPNLAERDAVGAGTTRIVRGTPEFAALVSNTNPGIVFKDEEGTGADRMMTARLAGRLDALANSVAQEWTGVKLRVTEAWDENIEHSTNSVHYEARGADLTTSPIDEGKLGRLGRLAVDAGFEWVFFENAKHIHVSMAK